MTQNELSMWQRWLAEKKRQRGRRALERQLDYQETKAEQVSGSEVGIGLTVINHAQTIRKRLEKIQPISGETRILEVGSGAHGLIFGFGNKFKVGIDPLAVDYRRLFPAWQRNVQTIAAIGEKLPFADASFDVVLSDNVIDHAENPIKIVEELARVLKPEGLLYFTVNIHHPIYSAASAAHGWWNALGIRFELSPFADHTIHFTENKIKEVFARLPFQILEENSSIEQTKAEHRQIKPIHFESILKKVFFKNALFEVVAIRK
ncbi:MAG: class I SAM-dependent methyltransferase [Acidobacteriota bacterium]